MNQHFPSRKTSRRSGPTSSPPGQPQAAAPLPCARRRGADRARGHSRRWPQERCPRRLSRGELGVSLPHPGFGLAPRRLPAPFCRAPSPRPCALLRPGQAAGAPVRPSPRASPQGSGSAGQWAHAGPALARPPRTPALRWPAAQGWDALPTAATGSWLKSK